MSVSVEACFVLICGRKMRVDPRPGRTGFRHRLVSKNRQQDYTSVVSCDVSPLNCAARDCGGRRRRHRPIPVCPAALILLNGRRTAYTKHFVLAREKRDGDTVTCQGKKFTNSHHHCGIQSVYILHHSDTQRAQVWVIDESLRQNHFICHDFLFQDQTPVFSSLPMAKF
jgi:hypothetical protein